MAPVNTAQVFQSGNILLHQPSNLNYCVSLRQLAVALPIMVNATASWAETSGPWWRPVNTHQSEHILKEDIVFQCGTC